MNHQDLFQQDLDLVASVVNDYFTGLHEADIATLQRIFHPDAVLKAPGLRRSLSQWLDLVSTREIPAQQGTAFGYRVLAIDVIHDQAMVKVLCPLLGRTYIDFLGLLKEDGQWRIVNKMYADV